MSAALQKLLGEALGLATEEREALAHALLDSVASSGDVHLSSSWRPELARRVADVDARLARGETVGRDADELLDELDRDASR